MKKIIRILGLTLVLGMSLASCTKEVEVLEPSLFATYKYMSATVPVAVDINKDGIKNTNLALEKGDGCAWNRTWQYQKNNKVTLREAEACITTSRDGADKYGVIGTWDYIYNAAAKTITINYSGGYQEVYEDVKLYYSNNNKQTLYFTLYQKDISQIVTYNLVSIY